MLLPDITSPSVSVIVKCKDGPYFCIMEKHYNLQINNHHGPSYLSFETELIMLAGNRRVDNVGRKPLDFYTCALW